MEKENNNQNKIVLSICIPTYNRLKTLRKLIGYFQRELDDQLKETVEVIISNDCSNDGTTEFLSGIKDDRFVIINQYKNLGASANMAWCEKKASGEYFWMVGDDDYLKVGLLNEIIDVISRYNVSYIYLPAAGYNEETKIVEKHRRRMNIEYDVARVLDHNDLYNLIKEFGPTLMFQTSAVIKKRYVDKSDVWKHESTSIAHTLIESVAAMSGGSSFFFSEVKVLQGQESTWSDKYFNYMCVCYYIMCDELSRFGLSITEINIIRNWNTARQYGRALFNKSKMKQVKDAGFPYLNIRICGIIILQCVNKVIRFLLPKLMMMDLDVETEDFGVV